MFGLLFSLLLSLFGVTEVVVVMSFMLMFGLVSMLLFFYALHRHLRLKHEIEEEKEAIRYRLRRQKKMELL